MESDFIAALLGFLIGFSLASLTWYRFWKKTVKILMACEALR